MKRKKPVQGQRLPFRQRVKKRAKTIGKHAVIGAIIGAGTATLGRRVVLSMRPAKPEERPVVKAPAEQRAAKRPVLAKPVLLGFPEPSAKMSVLLPANAKCLSADFIDAELRSRNSPAAGFGRAFVKWGRFYGVRPSVGLAFFRKESNWGTKGIAVETKAIGNIRFTPSSGNGVRYTNYKGFRKYASWEDGIRDWFWLISSKNYAGSGLTSLEDVISKYAPTEDRNDPASYRKIVVSYLDELYKNASR